MCISRVIQKLKSHPHPVRFVLSRLLAKTGLCSAFTIQMDGFRLRFHPAAVPMTLWCNPESLAEDTTFLRAFLRHGDTYVDVGANVGQLTLQAAACIQNPQNIIAIEAHPVTYAYLTENLALNGLQGVKAIHCAVGASEGNVKFTSKHSDDQNEISAQGDVEVPLKPLDMLVNFPEITLLKIDVEGFELFVLQGAADILSRTQTIYFEAWDELFAKHGYSFSDVSALLKASGFSFFSLRDKTLTPFLSATSPDFTNLLAIRSVDWIQGRGFQISA